MSGVHFFPQG